MTTPSGAGTSRSAVAGSVITGKRPCSSKPAPASASSRPGADSATNSRRGVRPCAAKAARRASIPSHSTAPAFGTA